MIFRGCYILSCLLVAIFVGWKWGHLLMMSEGVLGNIVSVFSILAGVLVAVISIIGDPSMLIPGNWRVGYEHAKDVQKRIGQFSHLFALYIITLIILLVAIVVKDAELNELEIIFPILTGLVTFGLLVSVPLSYSLMGIQKDRMQQENKRRRNKSES